MRETVELRMMLVLVRTPETCGHGSVVRITSANIAVLLVPSVMLTRVTPWRTVVPDHEAAKMPAPGPVLVGIDVVPMQAR